VSFPRVINLHSLLRILKKPGLNSDSPSNYRPISNLNNISKILERLFLCTFQPHVTACPFFTDSGHATLLVLLDLSAAFDTIDHDILISRLQHSFGISGPVLSWLKSYLHNRSQSVRVGSVSTNSFTLTTGVPQGSVLVLYNFQFTFHLSVPSLLLTICSTSSMLMTLNCTSLYLPQILRLQSPGSNPVSQIFTVGFHTAASV